MTQVMPYTDADAGTYVTYSGLQFSHYFTGNGNVNYNNQVRIWYDYCSPDVCTVNIVDTYNTDCASMAGVSSDCSELLNLTNDNNWITGYQPYYLDKGSDGQPLTYTLKYTLTCTQLNGNYTATSNEWIIHHSPCMTQTAVNNNAFYNRISTYTSSEYEIRRDTSSSAPIKLGDSSNPSISDWLTQKDDTTCPRIQNNCWLSDYGQLYGSENTTSYSNGVFTVANNIATATRFQFKLRCSFFDPTNSIEYATYTSNNIKVSISTCIKDDYVTNAASLVYSFGPNFNQHMNKFNCYTYSLPQNLKRLEFDTFSVAAADGTECDYVIRKSASQTAYTGATTFEDHLTEFGNNATTYMELIDDGTSDMLNNLQQQYWPLPNMSFYLILQFEPIMDVDVPLPNDYLGPYNVSSYVMSRSSWTNTGPRSRVGNVRNYGGGGYHAQNFTDQVLHYLPSCGQVDNITTTYLTMSVCIPEDDHSTNVYQCNTSVDTSLYYRYPSSYCDGDPCLLIDQVADVSIDETFNLMLSFTLRASDGNTYVQELYYNDQIITFTLQCGHERFDVPSVWKNSYNNEGARYANEHKPWPVAFSYWDNQDKNQADLIYFDEQNSTNEINTMHETDHPNCTHQSFELYSDKNATVALPYDSSTSPIEFRGSLTAPYFRLFRDQGTWETIYMKVVAINQAKWAHVVIPIVFHVCGVQEQVTIQSPQYPLHRYNSTSNAQVINSTVIQTYFSASSEAECPIIGFDLPDYANYSYEESGSTKYTISSIFTNTFDKTGVLDQKSLYYIDVMAGQQYSGNKTILPQLSAVTSGNKHITRQINITIDKRRPDCEAASFEFFDQETLDNFFIDKYGREMLYYLDEDRGYDQFPYFGFLNPIIYSGTDLDQAGITCNYNNYHTEPSPNGNPSQRAGIINYVVHDFDLQLYKYYLYDMDEITMELDPNAKPYLFPYQFINVTIGFQDLVNETSYEGFERKFGEDIVQKATYGITFNMTEDDPTKPGWYQFTLKSSFWVDNPSDNFNLITMEKEYKFLLDFCRTDYLIDSTDDQRALGNKTVMQYLQNWGKINFQSPFKDIFKYYPECDSYIQVLQFVDLEYEISEYDQIMLGVNFNELSEYIPDQFKVNRLDEKNNLVPTPPQEDAAEIQLTTLIDNDLLVFDRLNENFTINCAGAYMFGVYKIHMWTYPKLYRRSVQWEMEQAGGESNDTWKYEHGDSQIFQKDRKDFIFYVNVSWDPLTSNDPPHFATPGEGGFKFNKIFVAQKTSLMPSIKLPKIMNLENKTEIVRVEINTDAIYYVNYDPSLPGLVFQDSTMNLLKDVNFQVTIKDDHPKIPAKTDYDFQILCLYCRKKPFKPVFKVREDGPINSMDKINFNDLVPAGEIPVPPVLQVKPISSLGMLTFTFSKPMDFPKEIKKQYQSDKKQWNAIYQQLMDPNADPDKIRKNAGRRLKVKKDLIQFSVDASNPDEQDKMDFKSYLVNLESAKMEFQLYFANPKIISMGSQENKDQMKITLSKSLIETLKSSDSQNLPLDLSNYNYNLVIAKGIPCQMPISASSENFVENAKTADGGMKLIVVVNFAMSFLVAFSLNFLWSMINSLQMIVYLPLLNIILPANVNTLFAILIEVATFDVVPKSDEINKFVFKFKYTTTLMQQSSFESLGFETKNFIINQGSLFIFQTIFVCQLIIIAILRRIAPKFNILIHFYRKLKLKQHLNSIIIRFILEGFVEVFLSCLINMELMSQVDLIFLNPGDTINFMLSMLYFIYALFLPLILSSVINTKITLLESQFEEPPANVEDVKTYYVEQEIYSKEFDKKWDSLYQSLRQESNFAMQYYYVYALRRMVFIMIAYYFNPYPGIQLMCQNYLMLFLIIYLIRAKPFADVKLSKMEVTNELMLLAISISLYSLTDWQQSSENKLIIGNFIVYMTLANVVFNLVSTGIELVRMAKYNYRKQKYKRDLRAQMKIIMKRFSVRQQHQISRAIKSKNEDGTQKYTPENFRDSDRLLRRKFKMKHIIQYELSDIPEEEAPEQACTDFDRQDGKYIALPPDVNVVARPKPETKITTDQRVKIREGLIKKQQKQNDIDDVTNANFIRRLKDAKREALKKENELRERKQQVMRQTIEAQQQRAQVKNVVQRQRKTKVNQKQKKLQDQAHKADLKMFDM